MNQSNIDRIFLFVVLFLIINIPYVLNNRNFLIPVAMLGMIVIFFYRGYRISKGLGKINYARNVSIIWIFFGIIYATLQEFVSLPSRGLDLNAPVDNFGAPIVWLWYEKYLNYLDNWIFGNWLFGLLAFVAISYLILSAFAAFTRRFPIYRPRKTIEDKNEIKYSENNQPPLDK